MKKYIVPLIFAMLFVAVLSLYLYIYVIAFKFTIVKVIYLAAVISIIIAMIFTVKSRFNEIKEEEKDDISKY